MISIHAGFRTSSANILNWSSRGWGVEGWTPAASFEAFWRSKRGAAS